MINLFFKFSNVSRSTPARAALIRNRLKISGLKAGDCAEHHVHLDFQTVGSTFAVS